MLFKPFFSAINLPLRTNSTAQEFLSTVCYGVGQEPRAGLSSLFYDSIAVDCGVFLYRA